MTLEQRMKKMETANRWLIGLVVVMIVAAFLNWGWSIGTSRNLNRVIRGQVPMDTLTVRTLDLRNIFGEQVGYLSTNTYGRPQLILSDAYGRMRLNLGIHDAGPRLAMFDDDKEERLSVTVDEKGGSLLLNDKDNYICAMMAQDENGSGYVATLNKSSRPLTVMGRGDGEVGRVAVFDREGRPVELAQSELKQRTVKK